MSNEFSLAIATRVGLGLKGIRVGAKWWFEVKGGYARFGPRWDLPWRHFRVVSGGAKVSRKRRVTRGGWATSPVPRARVSVTPEAHVQ